MTLSTNFQLSFNPVWSMVDLNGIQANSTFYMWVLSNTVPYNPAPVYQDPAGTIPWGEPIQFLANGTLPVNIYWDNTMTYRLEIRQNLGLAPPSQSDPLIYLVENYIPNNSTGGQPIGEDVATDNQLANPQFANMSAPGGFVLVSATNPASIEVAPGWFLDLTGTGNVTVQQVSLNTNLPNPTNAPYALQITLTGGWTGQPVLRQRFQQNGQNWMGKYVAGSLTAMVASGTAALVVRLDASNGQPLGIVQTPFVTNAFAEYTGNVLIPPFVNLDFPPDAYIDYKVLLPPNVDIYLTSMQLVVSSVASNFGYEQITVDRQIDHLFHYYQPKLEYKPIPSYLVGWDFPLNPAQIIGAGTSGSPLGPFASGINTANYFWDQTIVYQTATSGVSGFRAANGGLTLTAAANGQIAVIQYLDQAEARKILSDRASVHLSLSGATASPVNGNVTLWATTDANLPTITNCIIATTSVSGIPLTFHGNWTQVPNVYQNTAFNVPTASSTNSESNDISLNGWDMAGAVPTNTATYFAIVVGFSAWVTDDTITLNSIGLCAGDIATRPAPKTLDETQKDCERFYEKSYQNSAVAGTVTNYNLVAAPMQSSEAGAGPGGNTYVLETAFTVNYRTNKRIPATQGYPTVYIYSPVSGTVGNVRLYALGNALNTADDALTIWGTTYYGNKYAAFAPTTNSAKNYAAPANTDLSVWITYHYVADARLGVVN